MHEPISRIVIAAAVLAALSFLAIGCYTRVAEIPSATEGALFEKACEIGIAAYRNEGATVFGVSTGRLVMTTAEVDPVNLTLRLPGGDQYLLLRRHAICVKGGALAVPPSENFSVSTPENAPYEAGVGVRLVNGEEGGAKALFIMPVPVIGYSCSVGDLGVKVHSFTIALASLEGGLSASGTFDLLLLKNASHQRHYARFAAVPGEAEVWVNGEKAIGCHVGAGEKVVVDVIVRAFDAIRIR